MFSSVEASSPSKQNKQKKNTKKRSKRSNLQRTKTPKKLSYKGSTKERNPKTSNTTNKTRRGSSNRRQKSINENVRKELTSLGSNESKYDTINDNVAKSSIASSIVDKWDVNDGRERISLRNRMENEIDSSLSSFDSRRKSSNTTFQLARFLDKQEEFCETLQEYRQVWYPDSEKQAIENPNDWKAAVDLEHPDPNENLPWLDIDWQTIVDSEDLFRRVCSIHHDLFVACSSYLTDLSETHTNHHQQQQQQHRYEHHLDEWTEQDLLRLECEELLAAILPTWERLRRERALLVEAYRPAEEGEHASDSKNNGQSSEQKVPKESHSNNQEIDFEKNAASTDTSYENNRLVGWLKGMITGTDKATIDVNSDADASGAFERVTAHLDPECAPNHYHYTKLVGRLYFHYLPLERHNRSNPFHLYSKSDREGSDNDETTDGKVPYKQALSTWEEKRMEILSKRSEQMQAIVDQSLLPLIPNRNNSGTSVSKPQHHDQQDEFYDDTSDRVLTDKIVRLLIRSYLDMESLPAAQQAERVYHRHPNHRKRLLWYVTMCYLKVITTNKKALARAASASTDSDPEQQKESFLKHNEECATSAKRICELISSKHAKEAREFQHCSTIAFEALAILPQYGRRGLKGYYDRVHSLGILKFGPKVWEALLEGTPDENQQAASSSQNRSRRRKRKMNRKSSLATQETTTSQDSSQLQTAKQPIDLTQSLHSKDHKILNYLIQIYSHEEKDLHRALRLLNVSLDLYAPYDLKESIDRSTFHKLLKKLSEQRRKAHIDPQQPKSPEINEFDTAIHLLDSMVSEAEWFPTEETFRILFSMIPYCENPGMAAEQLRSKLEACRFLYSLNGNKGGGFPEAPPLVNPLEVSALTLRAWLQSPQQAPSEVNPSQRALAILKAMNVGSSSLFPKEDATTNPQATPTLYSLGLEVCSRDIGSPRITHETAMEIFELLQTDNQLLDASCGSLLGVVGNFSKQPNVEDNLLLSKIKATKQIYEALDEPQPSILEFLQEQASFLRLRHPELYQEHFAELGLLEDDGGVEAKDETVIEGIENES